MTQKNLNDLKKPKDDRTIALTVNSKGKVSIAKASPEDKTPAVGVIVKYPR